MDIIFQLLFVIIIVLLQGCCSIKELSESTVSDKLIPPIPFAAVVRGEDHTLFCSKIDRNTTTADISWHDVLPSGVQVPLFIGGEKQTTDQKYNEFGIDYDTQFEMFSNLLIKNMTISKEGSYGCSLESEMHLASRTMEVDATDFKIYTIAGETPDIVRGIDGDTVQLTCKSVAARPALDLRWYHKMEKESDSRYTHIQNGIIEELKSPNDQDGDTFDTTSVLRYSLQKSYNYGILKCDATGQIAATLPSPNVLTLLIQWPPEVHVTYDHVESKITCDAYANPNVLPNDYVIIIAGKHYNGQQTLVMKITKKTEVRCEASNDLGTGQATVTIYVGDNGSNKALSAGAIVGIAIGIAVIAVATGLAFAAFKLPRNQSNMLNLELNLQPVDSSLEESPYITMGDLAYDGADC